MTFTGILHTEIESVWPEVRPFIASACERMSGRMDEEDVKRFLLSGDMQLWVNRKEEITAVCVTEVINYPKKKACRIFIGTGKNRRDWQNYRWVIEEWARSQGCDGMESFARKGWARIFTDYKSTHIILEKGF